MKGRRRRAGRLSANRVALPGSPDWVANPSGHVALDPGFFRSAGPTRDSGTVQGTRTVKAPVATAVVTGMPVSGFSPTTTLVTRVAGRPRIRTVGLPTVTAPTQTEPATMSPMHEAGIPAISTVGAPGPVITSPVTVTSVSREAGKGMGGSPVDAVWSRRVVASRNDQVYYDC